MALRWNIEKVEGWKALADDAGERAITQAIVFHTMSIGINRITDENAEEVARRIRMVESVHRPSLMDENGPRWIDIKDIRRRVGLSTNASSITKRAFDARLKREWMEGVEQRVRHEIEEAGKAALTE